MKDLAVDVLLLRQSKRFVLQNRDLLTRASLLVSIWKSGMKCYQKQSTPSLLDSN